MPKRSSKAKRPAKVSRPPGKAAHQPGSGLVRIGDILPQLMARHGFQRQLAAEKLENAWNEAVGETLGRITRPGGKRRGCLEILVPHNAFAQDLSFRSAELLAALQRLVPEEGITRLKFVVRSFSPARPQEQSDTNTFTE